MTIRSEIQQLATDALIEMFILDLTMFPGGDVYYFTPNALQTTPAFDGGFSAGFSGGFDYFFEAQESFAPVVWQEKTYIPAPIKSEGFEFNGKGQFPRPKLSVANANGLITGLIILFNDLVGAKITRKRTFYKFLDGQPGADPLAGFPDDIFFIERKVVENKTVVQWELASAMDVTGVLLPRRQFVANSCPWKYRGSECGYTGSSYFDANDVAVSNLNADQCGKRLNSCKKRFGQYNELPFGGFPAANL